jgi:hypothetical protein
LRRLATGTWRKSDSGITLILEGQEEGVDIPVYGRQAQIEGSVHFEKRDEEVTEVKIKVCHCCYLLGEWTGMLISFRYAT